MIGKCNMTNVKRIFKNTWNQITRSRLMTIATVVTMTATFLVISVFAVVAYGSDRILNYFESKAQVTAFFVDEAGEEDILNIKSELEATGLTAEVRYISKEEALQLYLGQHEDDPILLESITANIFPASLDVRAKDVDDLPTLVSILDKKETVEEILFYQDVVQSLKSWTRTIRYVGLGLIAVLVLISVTIILVTVNISVSRCSGEIEVMRLVGASNWYIRWPFILQGALTGLVSAILAVGILAGSTPLLITKADQLLRGMDLVILTPRLFLVLLGAEAVLGILLGAFGSLVAVWRYLRY